MFCVYLTIYSGNKLPPFYIGYTTLDKIEKGYAGTVGSKIYKDIYYEEIKNNPELFKTHIISRRETRSEALQREGEVQRFFAVHKNPMYINKSVSNEKFYCDDHSFKQIPEYGAKIAANNRRVWADPEHRKKRSEALRKAKSTPEYRKKQSKIARKLANDPAHREKLSKGVTESWNKPGERERRSEILKQRYKDKPELLEKKRKMQWWNNGEIAIHSVECPKGFVKGRGTYWTDGTVNTIALVCPDGFWKGMTKKPKS